jgi:hypothetical protein
MMKEEVIIKVSRRHHFYEDRCCCIIAIAPVDGTTMLPSAIILLCTHETGNVFVGFCAGAYKKGHDGVANRAPFR